MTRQEWGGALLVVTAVVVFFVVGVAAAMSSEEDRPCERWTTVIIPAGKTMVPVQQCAEYADRPIDPLDP